MSSNRLDSFPMFSFLKRTLAFSFVMLSSIGLIGVAGPSHAFTPSCTLLPARSATVGGEVFLGGDFIELGLSARGSWGTSGNKPAGFRATSDSRLGMGADLDGYCATPSDNTDLPVDFFLPGGPEERWGVGFTMAGQEHYGSYSVLTEDASSTGVTAVHTVTDETSGDNLSAKVVSVISLAGSEVLRVTATHSFQKSQAYFRTSVVFDNLSGSALTDVRFHRSFDPDNAVFQGGQYDTRQTILDTVSDGGTSVVQAKLIDSDLTALAASGEILDDLLNTSGITTEIPILFYSAEPQSVAYFGGFENPDPYKPAAFWGDSTDFFDSPQAKDSTVEADRGMGIIVRTLSLAAGASSSALNFITSLDSRDFSEISNDLSSASSGDSSSSQEPSAPRAPRFARFDAYSVGLSESGSPQLAIEGVRLWCINSLTVDEIEVPFETGFSTPWYEYIHADITGIQPGPKTLVAQTCMGEVTYENWLTITALVDPKSTWMKAQSFGLNESMRSKIAAFNSSLGDGYYKIRCIVNSANGEDMNEAFAKQICSFAQSNDLWQAEVVHETKATFTGRGYWVNIWASGGYN